MTDVLVDSNVLIDIVKPGEPWAAWSETALRRAAAQGRLVINPIIFGEVSIGYDGLDEAEEALPEAMFAREPLSHAAAFLAGRAFLAYRRRGGIRTSPLSDFLIGAHAAVAGYTLLTRDGERYRTYFPRLSLIAPE